MCSSSKLKDAKLSVAPNYTLWGDTFYGLCLLNTVIYCISVMFYKDSSFFDKTWAKDGFCVSNPTVPFWTSHDMCLYADVVLASICGIAYLLLRKKEGMEKANDLVFFNIFGIIAHGLGHGGIGAAMRDESSQQLMEDDVSYFTAISGDNKGFLDIGKDLFLTEKIGFWVFWIFLLKASMRQTSMLQVIIPLSFLSYLGNLAVPPSFGFTYVQTVLLIAFCVNQLVRPKDDKGFEYFLYALIVSFPLGIVGWIESTMCSSTIIHYGGHLLYDAYIPISMFAFYLISYNHHMTEKSKLKAE